MFISHLGKYSMKLPSLRICENIQVSSYYQHYYLASLTHSTSNHSSSSTNNHWETRPTNQETRPRLDAKYLKWNKIFKSAGTISLHDEENLYLISIKCEVPVAAVRRSSGRGPRSPRSPQSYQALTRKKDRPFSFHKSFW